jgi:hypothetical protein
MLKPEPKPKESTIVHNYSLAIVMVIATILLIVGPDLNVIEIAHAAAGHGASGGSWSSLRKKSDGFLGVWSFML